MDLHVSTSTGQHPFKVLIRSLTGEYLAGSEGQWRLTRDRSTALVCDYLRDRIADQLQRLEQTEGIVLLAELVNPRDALETCDRCGRCVPSPNAHFDGREFFCPECNSKSQRA
jgi:hypothetical protein